MKRPITRYLIMLAMGLILAIGLVLSLRPQAVMVDLAEVSRGSMNLTVRDEGIARIKDVYRVSAPSSGHLLRPSLRSGDMVLANQTVLARIFPNDPLLLDDRTRAQAEAAVRGAQAALELAKSARQRAQAQLEYANAQYQRGKTLADRGELSAAELDLLRLARKAALADQQSAHATQQMRAAELGNAEAVLSPRNNGNEQAMVSLHAPIDGRVLQVFEESETVVTAGQPLISLGDPAKLEVVTDLLSSDAVKLSPGAKVELSAWGGDHPLAGQLQQIEPFGYTKLSALGVEEQRVNAVIEIVSPFETWQSLQHGYRMDVSIEYWRSDDVLRVPTAALFRQAGQWHVFKLKQQRLAAVALKIGHINAQWAEVLSGLEMDDQIVLYPSEELQHGTLVKSRSNASSN